ncbi:pirin family protein [Acinetobacter sp. MD2]|uniref:pirin family protein n=1 Tax=Acinetobacter sp. MD2 TaxID=2600066 RepID=UPI002D1F9861|nr:pirin family protein [Acinetobacter sp. MD2]
MINISTAPTTPLQEIPLRVAEIGRGTTIKRALPSRQKRMIGAWCFLDHAGPAQFEPGQGLDVGPHPHIGLQTFTWMIEGTLMHHDSIGSEQLIRPKQVNLMTAGHGISHTEVAPSDETKLHAAQLWIALPAHLRNMPPQFQHYPKLPTQLHDQLLFSILVGEFLGETSPVEVHSPLLAVDIHSTQNAITTLTLKPDFEYALLLLEGSAKVNGQVLHMENMFVRPIGDQALQLELADNSRVLLIGGEPFEKPVLLWWNLVGITEDELKQANQDWIDQHPRFGSIPSYSGARLTAPPFPAHIKEST